MSLYKRGNVWWTAVWVDGVRTMRSLETQNRREAERRARVIEDDLRARSFQPELRLEMTFGELYTRFLAEGDVKPHHLDRAKHFLPYFVDLPIGRITKNDAVRYRKYRQEEASCYD